VRAACSKVAAPSYARSMHASTQDGHTHTHLYARTHTREGRWQILEMDYLFLLHIDNNLR